MHRRVRIGITSALKPGTKPDADSEVFRHVAAVRRAGGEPVVLARGYETARALGQDALHGIVFSGGGDVQPERYGGRADLTDGRVDPVRDEGEFELIRATYIAGVPMLCVCRGLQVANVAFGGTLIEDLPSELGKRYRIEHHQIRESGQIPSAYTHELDVVPGSRFARLVGVSRFWTNSIHHQAVRTLASPFRAAAMSADGIIEAIESKDDHAFFLGVQWHPESLPEDDETSRVIYDAFVAACRKMLRR
jgi:putative glutamine amidotransferase